MSSGAEPEPGAAVSVWSHDQLSHLPLHAPLHVSAAPAAPVPQQPADGPAVSLGAAFPASAADGTLPLSSAHAPFFAPFCFSAAGAQAAPKEACFDNNNTTKPDLCPEGAGGGRQTASKPSPAQEPSPKAHWPLDQPEEECKPEVEQQEPRPARPDSARLPDEALSPNQAGIAVPTPQFGRLDSVVVSAHSRFPTDAAGDAVMNEDETARILLHISQNFGRSAERHFSSEAGSSPPSPSKAQKKCRTFFRAPGLEAPSAAESAEAGVLVCKVCGFSCSSRFHYNSHMNTHGCHRCQVPLCNYTSRTEGRLKKHMTDSHTEEQRREVGYVLSAAEPAVPRGPALEPAAAEEARLPHALEQMRALTEGANGFGSPARLDSQDSRDGSESGSATPAAAKRGGGKPKRYACKQCEHVSTNKDEHWRHTKLHIPPEKQLNCPDCEFVTEYKHHLQYHMRNHLGSKPFKCSKCEYTCVNKSMLNSHMKSHTPVYGYKCADCNYMTKYCHSLKMHLQKYQHRRVQGRVTGSEGSCVDELELDDSESSRAGDAKTADNSPGPSHAPPTPFGPAPTLAPARLEQLFLPPLLGQPGNSAFLAQQLLLQPQRVQEMLRSAAAGSLQPQLPRHKCVQCEFSTGSEDEMLRHNFLHVAAVYKQQPPQFNAGLYQGLVGVPQTQQLTQQPLMTDLIRSVLSSRLGQHQQQLQSLQLHSRALQLAEQQPEHGQQLKTEQEEERAEEQMANSPSAGCSASPSDSPKSLDNVSSGGSPHSSTSGGSKKQKAAKLDNIARRLQEGKSSPDTADERLSSPERADGDEDGFKQAQQAPPLPYTCQFCMVAFRDQALYQIHLGYHAIGYNTPFKCNRCGHSAASSLDFNLHLYQEKH